MKDERKMKARITEAYAARFKAAGDGVAVLPFGQPNNWLNKYETLKAVHVEVMDDLERQGRRFLKPAEEEEVPAEPPVKKAKKQAPVQIDVAKLCSKEKTDRILMVVAAYMAKAKTAGGAPIKRFGDPNEWLNHENFIELHEAAIAMAKTTGVMFHDAANVALPSA